MKRFTGLFESLDASNRTSEKVAALSAYFLEAPPADAAWALFFLTGGKLKRLVNTRLMREAARLETGLPEWLIETSYSHVGDLAETIALLLPEPDDGEKDQTPLHRWVEQLKHELAVPDPAERLDRLRALWRPLTGRQRFLLNKLLTGGFRVGVSKALVHRGLAVAFDLEPAIVAHRLMGEFQPSAEAFQNVIRQDAAGDHPARPYPFCLAYPLADELASGPESKLGPLSEWQVEWKWDGIRAQLIHRPGATMLWSRGGERVDTQFPEVLEATGLLPSGTVLDGELVAWDDSRNVPLGFGSLQRRLGRKLVGPKLRREVPVRFLAYDLLEVEGRDLRALGTTERRRRLEQLKAGCLPPLAVSPLVKAPDWAALTRRREESRARGVEGLMLKSLAAPYHSGRVKGDWWKWKVDPFRVDAVMIYAVQGHGRRAGLYTDYTFAVWRADELVSFAKAYSGLQDADIREVDRWIRAHTVDKHGPVRVVEPCLVFEIAFEGISESKRHKSGVAVRFPRISRWRRDKSACDADTLETVRALLDNA